MSYVVHIIESPSEQDFLDDRSEGRTLRKALKHAGLPATLHTVVSGTAFMRAIFNIAEDSKTNGTEPILHFSMHGNDEGIAFTSGTTVKWGLLAVGLGFVHRRCGGKTWLVMSTCQGFFAASMGFDQTAPFLHIVGSNEEIEWNDTVAVFTAFYHHVIRHGGTPKTGVALMNGIINRELFNYMSAAQVQQTWDFLKQIQASTPEELVEKVEELLGPIPSLTDK